MKYGLIGEKLGHSFSPQIHRALGCADYQLIPLEQEQFHSFMESKDFCGINVTIPYKEAVLPYCEEISERAKSIGAVNTIKVRISKQGRPILCGENTDFDGVLYLLRQHGIDLQGKTVMILGSGGTCKTVMAVAAHCGAKRLIKVSRTAGNGFTDYEQCKEEKTTQIIINTTPVGMYPLVGVSPVDLRDFPQLEAVVDVIFNPLETAFLRQGRQLGILAVGGLEMLVAQAKAAEEFFLETTIDDAEIDKIYRQLKQKIGNLVLIGMPGSGKTTVGRLVAEKLGKQLIDSDQLIEDRAKMKIADIFAQYGEDYFRRLEQEVLAEIGKEHCLVISTGGGVIKHEANIDALKQNGYIIFLDRSLEQLEIGNGRPLSDNRHAVAALYQERYPLYERFCDIKIENCGKAEDAAEKILAYWEAGI